MNLREAAADLMTTVEFAIKAGDWKVDGACDPTIDIERLRQALADEAMAHVWEQKEEQPWVKTYCGGKPNYCTPDADAINISQERVDETAKREHEPWPSVQCVCGGTIYFKYTPPISDYHEGWEEGFKAAKHKWVELTDDERDHFRSLGFVGVLAVEAKLKEKNAND
jgi:hypothetical protein